MQLPHGSSSITSAFIPAPRHVHFENQREGEELYMLLRSHEITNLPWIITVFVLLLVPLFAGGFVVAAFPSFFETVHPLYAFILFLLWNVGVLMYAFYKYLIWFFSAYIITSNRLVDIDFFGLFHKDYTETSIFNVQDVTAYVSGPLHVMFNFGLVYVQTASEITEIDFENVPRPDAVTKVISDLVLESGGRLQSSHGRSGVKG